MKRSHGIVTTADSSSRRSGPETDTCAACPKSAGAVPMAAAGAVFAAAAVLLALSGSLGLAFPAWAQDPHGSSRLVSVPSAGIEVELWSSPAAGSVVRPGSAVRFHARANADCYLTVFSVDTEGRMRMLYPHPFDDGWIAGGRTYTVPGPHSGYDLHFSGPPGIEYVYALASLYPLRSRYPSWMTMGTGSRPDPEEWGDDVDPIRDGWIVGDPFYQVRGFCEDLVPYPEERDTYATAWVYFHLGRRVPYPRYLCSDCHWGGWVDPYGPACAAIRIRCGSIHHTGHFDFRLAWYPWYTYEVWTGWRPRSWHGHRWSGPDGRWVWSSADGRRVLRDRFVDAGPRGRTVAPPGIRQDGDRDPRVDIRPEPRGNPRADGRDDIRSGGRGDPRPNPRGDLRTDRRDDVRATPREGRADRNRREPEVTPSSRTRADGSPWGRGFDERLRRAVGEREGNREREARPPAARPREPEARPPAVRPPEPGSRNTKPGPGVSSPRVPAKPDRSDRGRESRGSKESTPRSPNRSAKEGRSRSR